MQVKSHPLKQKAQYLKGVGPKRAQQLSRLGITTVGDLIYYMPRRYEDRRKISPIKDVAPGSLYTVKGRIKRHGIWKSKKGLLIYDMVITDGTGSIHGVWYNQPYLKRHFSGARHIILCGNVEKFKYLQMAHPDYEVLDEADKTPDALNIGRIVPIYPLTRDVTQKYLRGIISGALENSVNTLKETLPTPVRARNRLADIKFAVKNIHFPDTPEGLKMAYRRLVFEEFFILEAALALTKNKMKKVLRGIEHRVEKGLFESFKKMLPFALTKEQAKAMKDLEEDMKAPRPMNRLLEGEVGSGKTIVAMYALFLTIKNSFQGAVMAPTEILAQQHYMTMSEFFMPLGINVCLLTGGTGGEARKKALASIKSGEADIIIGTHTLIQEEISFDRIGTVIIDEQHKFGVSQRALLRKKGVKSDVLIMTATPIPRTLALTVYGDLDISVMRGLPEGRAPVSTYWVEEERKDKLYKFLAEEISAGRQAYVVCPRIGEGAESGLTSAISVYERLKTRVFPGLKTAIIHGRMKSREKEKIMRDFKRNKINILVSTSLIEVGIDVPNATVMVIENADRFGLAQLHQLRGRIGRGEHKSYCILLSDPKNEKAKKRLEAFERVQDGFELAEEDMSIRGPGQLLGLKQHGLPEMRLGDISADRDILELARREAFELVEKDSGLKDEKNRNLREVILERYKGKMTFLRIG